jgi:phage terminase large subunit
VPKLSVEDGINAARTIFPNCWFDEEKCADGLHALRHYRYEVDEDLGTFSRKPLHDWASHGADGFRYLAVAAKPKPRRMAGAYARRRSVYRERGSWMAA